MITKKEDMVTITKFKYHEMLENLRWLSALENAGVDNWQGIEYAQDAFDEAEQSRKDS